MKSGVEIKSDIDTVIYNTDCNPDLGGHLIRGFIHYALLASRAT